MSKHVKDLVSKEIAHRLVGVGDAVLVNVVGLDAGKTFSLRRQLRQKDIHLMVVKNSLAKRATQGTPLAHAFQGVDGTLAMVWGSEDFISLAKEVTALDGSAEFPAFQTRGGVMDGEHLTADGVRAVSKWPNREEQIRILLGQILSPGANLVSQLLGPGRSLASQVEEKGKSAGEDEPKAEESGEPKAEESSEPKAEGASEPQAEGMSDVKSEE